MLTFPLVLRVLIALGSLACHLALLQAGETQTEELLFSDPFRTELKPGWRWLREARSSWRINPNELQIRVEPGNMWGPANNAKNVLVRHAPDPSAQQVEVTVTVSNKPTHQYEQVDLVWFFDDSNMVKIGQELVDEKLSIVMGREEADRTRTIAIIPIDLLTVEVRFVVKNKRIEGSFRKPGARDWIKAGECDLPARGDPNVALQCYQGPPDAVHWATLTDFSIRVRASGPGTD